MKFITRSFIQNVVILFVLADSKSFPKNLLGAVSGFGG